MSAPYDIVAVEHVGGFRLRLSFADGLVREIDLASKIEQATGPVFQPLKNIDFFVQVRVDPDLGTIVWPNGADLAPDVLHSRAASAA